MNSYTCCIVDTTIIGITNGIIYVGWVSQPEKETTNGSDVKVTRSIDIHLLPLLR
jgi:hypothetical protein